MRYIGGVVGIAAVTGATAIASSFFFSSKPKPLLPPVDLNNQSEEERGDDHVRRSRLYHDGEWIGYLHKDVKTLYDILYRGLKVSDDGLCMGWRKSREEGYRWTTYSEVIQRCRMLASGLVHFGAKPGPSTCIGIYAQNSVEWVLCEQACYHQSMVIIPLYDTLGLYARTFIINQAEINTIICDTEEKVITLLNESSKTTTLKQIIVFHPVSEDAKGRAKNCGVQLLLLKDVEEAGKDNSVESNPPKPTDLAVVCYTSGTTGNPKGVMLTHGQIVANVSAVIYQLGEQAPNSSDIMLSFLPLAHMFERCCEVGIFIGGGRIGFYMGDIRKLSDDMEALKPTVLPVVPRLLNRIYDKVQSSANDSKLKQWLLNLAVSRKQAEINRHIFRHNSIWDHIVFRQIRNGVGGQLRLMVIGSAPVDANVLNFMRCALGCLIVEGYGQTECVAPCTLTLNGDAVAGHVGPPLPCCSIKLVDVPDMEYFAADGYGEVCVKGLNVCSGYLKDQSKTDEVIDGGGWLHTGDIGMWLPNGALKIIDRKKHIFKLAQGEYISPEKIENIYVRSQFVAQVYVYGESLKSCIIAVVVPDKDILIGWSKTNGISGDWMELCRNEHVKKTILSDMVKLGKKEGLKSFEQVKDIYVCPDLFTVDNGLLTPTLKTKRPECRKFFQPQLEDLYRGLA